MLEIFDFEQGSDEWFRARMGIPTASEFGTLLMKGKGGGESKTRQTYLYKLAGEIITGEPMENYTNAHMERGKIMEDEARKFYAFMQDEDLTRVGFVKNGNTGCSPDSLIGEKGILEIKTKLPHLMVELLLKDEVPNEHLAQCQGNLWVTEREWIDIAIYWPKMPLFTKRLYRDEVHIKTIASAVNIFNEELSQTVDRLRRLSGPQEKAA